MKNEPKADHGRDIAKDALLQTTPEGEVQLREDELDKVSGGITQDVTVNKAKTAEKAFQAMDGYVRG
ncbi:MAG: hypothetical protein QOJ52_4284 [Acidimicrobiaceae bacterium]|jgi:hypothetical protein|nr:hypothetical protein [Acidimicrobiaceae bacterium]